MNYFNYIIILEELSQPIILAEPLCAGLRQQCTNIYLFKISINLFPIDIICYSE